MTTNERDRPCDDRRAAGRTLLRSAVAFTGTIFALLGTTLGSLAASPPAVDASADVGSAPADTTITIRSTGANLEFLPARISAVEGTRVTVRYVNEGTLPHNFVLVRNEEDIDTLSRAALQAKDTDYVPLAYEDRMIAHSPLAAPGKTVEVTFEMPPAGEYFFVCLYSGHYNMMIGTLLSRSSRDP